ncbi:hypothetical protein STEG23_011664, partial [Scotinomys teguina]
VVFTEDEWRQCTGNTYFNDRKLFRCWCYGSRQSSPENHIGPLQDSTTDSFILVMNATLSLNPFTVNSREFQNSQLLNVLRTLFLPLEVASSSTKPKHSGCYGYRYNAVTKGTKAEASGGGGSSYCKGRRSNGYHWKSGSVGKLGNQSHLTSQSKRNATKLSAGNVKLMLLKEQIQAPVKQLVNYKMAHSFGSEKAKTKRKVCGQCENKAALL